MRRPSVLVLVAVLGCVPVHRSSSRPGDKAVTSPTGGVADMELERHVQAVHVNVVERVTNISYFDLAVCEPPVRMVSDVYSDEQLMAAITMARPHVLECLVPSDRRGRKEETHAVVTVVASPTSGVEATVGGDNVTEAGQTCVLEAVQKALSTLPPLPKGWPPVAAEVDFIHTKDTLPNVKKGVNELSDEAGKIRTALPSFCGCFEAWREAPPREIEMTINMRRPNADEGRAYEAPLSIHPHGVVIPTKLEGSDAQVAACLQDNIQAMEFKVPRLEVDIPFYFTFIDSRRDGPVDGLAPWLQHKQLEAVRTRRFAELAMAMGARSSAARNYDALVERWKQDKSVKVDALARSCQGLLRSDDVWAAAAQRKLEMEKASLPVAAQVGKETVLNAKILESERVLASASEIRKEDEKACPKTSWKYVPGRPVWRQVKPPHP
ncbi:MAG TPA: hypothetical protein VFA20_10675 [Myxococcaceae bacterium]|nr:hypothetical protein [Myxococcaceae bacterium]